MNFIFPLLGIYLLTRASKYARIFLFGGRVVRIKDGDSIAVRRWGFVEYDFRLAEIDAPELSQSGGEGAKLNLAKLIPVGTLVVIEMYGKGKGSRGRVIAHIYAGFHVNHAMVAEGHAWRYVTYSKDKRLSVAERKAKSNKKGLWSAAKAIAPWVYRKRKREGAKK